MNPVTEWQGNFPRWGVSTLARRGDVAGSDWRRSTSGGDFLSLPIPGSTTAATVSAAQGDPVRPEWVRSTGFTLVELMVSITVIAILASVVLVTMASSQRVSKVQRAKSQVARIHQMLVERIESIEGLRMPPATPQIPPWFVALWQRWHPSPPKVTHWMAFDRLQKVRETLRMELPDRGSDVRDFTRQAPDKLRTFTSNARYYVDFVSRRVKSGTDWGARFADAECLYMIVSRMEIGEANGLEFFSEREIGDKDGDGLPEIWDPWQNPIRFIRWPVGFNVHPETRSAFQAVPDPNSTAAGHQPPYNRQLFAADPFDVMEVDAGGFFYFPLVYSHGPDGISDVAHAPQDNSAWNPERYATRGDGPNDANFNNPFVNFDGSQRKWRIGAVDGDNDQRDNFSDNVHNHLLDTGIR